MKSWSQNSYKIIMEQSFLEKIFKNYDHLSGDKYLGCICEDKMDDLSNAIQRDNSLHDRTFALINTRVKGSNGEHWMRVIMNKRTNTCGYFDSFDRKFPWLINTLKKHFNNVHGTKYVVQAESVSMCGLHTLYDGPL